MTDSVLLTWAPEVSARRPTCCCQRVSPPRPSSSWRSPAQCGCRAGRGRGGWRSGEAAPPPPPHCWPGCSRSFRWLPPWGASDGGNWTNPAAEKQVKDIQRTTRSLTVSPVDSSKEVFLKMILSAVFLSELTLDIVACHFVSCDLSHNVNWRSGAPWHWW